MPVQLHAIGKAAFDGFLAACVELFTDRRVAASIDTFFGVLPAVGGVLRDALPGWTHILVRLGIVDMLSYRLGDEPVLVDKLPFNVLYLGFIAKAFPHARIIHLKRNPMDSCFAMYKQLFTWAYKFSYSLEGLGRFYPAYERLINHWQRVLGDRLIELSYEELVSDQESQTRRLLDKLDLDFEESCLNFEKLDAATATASFAQVRKKMHTRSVNRWKNYAQQMQPLKESLEAASIVVES